MSSFDLNRLVHIMSVNVFLDLRIEAGSIRSFNPERVTGDQSFTKYNKLTALISGY